MDEPEVLSRDVRDPDVALAIDSLEPPEVPNKLDAGAEFVRSEKLLCEDMSLLDGRPSRLASRFRSRDDGTDCNEDGAGDGFDDGARGITRWTRFGWTSS
ncbi:hypothetical protein V7S43_015477 [Phytophthora oleae]|uniref:Uncharacterized protein n=1 Tax=Phytophthora oleae TaxID=2107226 RepID=A0ABD3F1I7_9STRA